MSSNQWVKYICRYCDKEITDFKFIPPDCECVGFKEAKEKWQEEYRNEPDYSPPLTPEEYNAKYPRTYLGERLIVCEGGSYKLKLEARQYENGEALCVWQPFIKDPTNPEDEEEENMGLCFDFSERDARALYDMLTEYLKERGNATTEAC